MNKRLKKKKGLIVKCCDCKKTLFVNSPDTFEDDNGLYKCNICLFTCSRCGAVYPDFYNNNTCSQCPENQINISLESFDNEHEALEDKKLDEFNKSKRCEYSEELKESCENCICNYCRNTMWDGQGDDCFECEYCDNYDSKKFHGQCDNLSLW